MEKYLSKVLCLVFVLVLAIGYAQPGQNKIASSSVMLSLPPIPGSYLMPDYLQQLFNKRVAVVGNHTSLIHKTHLVDTLVSQQINVVKIFAPEHGFRGVAQAGEKVLTSKDQITGLPIISLYGKHLKPTADDLAGVDVVVFDIQDVGVRFYTYISTLQYVMEACADNDKRLIILDRPNPHAGYVDGPLLEKPFVSFVGMQTVPVVYGMTIAEYATMLVGEGWLNTTKKLVYTVVPCARYSHRTRWKCDVAPSPNLFMPQAIQLYPSICYFEGTPISLGRGTKHPFTVIGFPQYPDTSFAFTPHSGNKNYNPPYNDTLCYGINLIDHADEAYLQGQLSLRWVINMYNVYPDKKNFFTPFFDKLAGTDKVRLAIMNGKSEKEIRASWYNDIKQFKAIRKRYLLYPDFE